MVSHTIPGEGSRKSPRSPRYRVHPCWTVTEIESKGAETVFKMDATPWSSCLETYYGTPVTLLRSVVEEENNTDDDTPTTGVGTGVGVGVDVCVGVEVSGRQGRCQCGCVGEGTDTGGGGGWGEVPVRRSVDGSRFTDGGSRTLY